VDGKPVRPGQRLFAFHRINVVSADTTPVKFEILALTDNGQIKWHWAEFFHDSVPPKSN